jgi:hypothetical protein
MNLKAGSLPERKQPERRSTLVDSQILDYAEKACQGQTH